MNTVNITDFRNNIGTYIDRVIYKKEAFFIKKGKAIVAEVVAFDRKRQRERQTGLTKLIGLWGDLNWKRYRKAIKAIEAEDEKDSVNFS